MLERAPDQRALNYSYAQVLTKLGRGTEAHQVPRARRRSRSDVRPGHPAARRHLSEARRVAEGRRRPAAADRRRSDPTSICSASRRFFYLRAGMPEKARDALHAAARRRSERHALAVLPRRGAERSRTVRRGRRIYRQLLEKTPDDPDILASFGLTPDRPARSTTRRRRRSARSWPVPDSPQKACRCWPRRSWRSSICRRANYAAGHRRARSRCSSSTTSRTRRPINIALDALKKQKRYADAVALLQPLVDKYASDPFVNARYIEMLVRAGDKRTRPRRRRDAGEVRRAQHDLRGRGVRAGRAVRRRPSRC